MAEPIEMQFGQWTCVGSRNQVLAGAIHWRHLVNTNERFMHSSDVALCQNTLTTC